MKLNFNILIFFLFFITYTPQINAACLKNLGGNHFYIYDKGGKFITEITATHHVIIPDNFYPITISVCSNGLNTTTPAKCNSNFQWGSGSNYRITDQQCHIINFAGGKFWKTKLACNICK